MPVDHTNEVSKSNFVRSQSLRHPSKKASDAKVNPPFQRNGNAKLQSASLPSTTSASKPLSLFRRPILRSKLTPDRSVSKSPAHRALSVDDPRRSHLRSSTTRGKEEELALSDSPTSTRSDKSQTSHHGPCCPWSNNNNDLVYHLKKLTEEHEKLQVESARLRLQLVEETAGSDGLRSAAALSHSDSQLTSIPELDSPDSPDIVSCAEDRTSMLERLARGYRSELCRTEENLRRMQRKYWNMVMSREDSEGPLDEASHQVVELLDRLQRKQEEVDSRGEQARALEQQLQDCQDKLEEAGWKRDGLQRRLRHTEADLTEARESLDFLAAERATMAETLQEAEQLRSQQAGSEVVAVLRSLLTSAGDFAANHLGLQNQVREAVESEVEETEEALWLATRLERLLSISHQGCLSQHSQQPQQQKQDQPSSGQSWEWPDTELRHKPPQGENSHQGSEETLAAILQTVEELPEEERALPAIQHIYNLASLGGGTSQPWI